MAQVVPGQQVPLRLLQVGLGLAAKDVQRRLGDPVDTALDRHRLVACAAGAESSTSLTLGLGVDSATRPRVGYRLLELSHRTRGRDRD